jgi:hypothetical protein
MHPRLLCLEASSPDSQRIENFGCSNDGIRRSALPLDRPQVPAWTHRASSEGSKAKNVIPVEVNWFETPAALHDLAKIRPITSEIHAWPFDVDQEK